MAITSDIRRRLAMALAGTPEAEALLAVISPPMVLVSVGATIANPTNSIFDGNDLFDGDFLEVPHTGQWLAEMTITYYKSGTIGGTLGSGAMFLAIMRNGAVTSLSLGQGPGVGAVDFFRYSVTLNAKMDLVKGDQITAVWGWGIVQASATGTADADKTLKLTPLG